MVGGPLPRGNDRSGGRYSKDDSHAEGRRVKGDPQGWDKGWAASRKGEVVGDPKGGTKMKPYGLLRHRRHPPPQSPPPYTHSWQVSVKACL